MSGPERVSDGEDEIRLVRPIDDTNRTGLTTQTEIHELIEEYGPLTPVQTGTPDDDEDLRMVSWMSDL